MQVLISFCNSNNIEQSNLLLLNVFTNEKKWIKIKNKNNGFTGIAQDDDFIYALYQSAEPGIVIFEKKTLRIVLEKELPELKDPHSVLTNKDKIYIVSTGTDQVLEYCFSKENKEIIFKKVLWFPKKSSQQKDSYHINSIFIENKDIFISAFGLKKNERWSSAKNGFIFNISTNKEIIDSIYHPHSIIAKNKKIYYCESTSKSVKENHKTIIKLDSGYTRGLEIKERYLFLGTSSGRKNSKSSGLINNPADIGELVSDCRLLMFRKSFFGKYKKIKEFDFSQEHEEIYDIRIIY